MAEPALIAVAAESARIAAEGGIISNSDESMKSYADEYGLVLLADIAKKMIAKDRSPERVNLYEIMSKPVISIRGDMDIRYCARLFNRFGLNIAPVVEGECSHIIGTVSYNDIVLKGLIKLLD